MRNPSPPPTLPFAVPSPPAPPHGNRRRSRPVRKRRRAPRRPPQCLAGGGLSLPLGEGFGHLYAGRARRGLLLSATLFAALAAALHASTAAPTPALRILPLTLVLVLKPGIAYDAAAVARATHRGWVPRWYNRWYVYVAFSGAMLMLQSEISTWLRENVARAYSIPSLSREPALLRGDYLLAAPPAPGPVARGTPVVHQGDDGIERVARVVGLPGDTLAMRDKVLLVNGVPSREAYVRHLDPGSDPSSEEMEWQREIR